MNHITELSEARSGEDCGALRRGLRILRALAGLSSGGLKVGEISAITGLPRPTVYRILNVLVAEGFVAEVGDSKRFASKSSLHDPSTDATTHALVSRFKDALIRIAIQTGNSVFLVKRTEDDSFCLHREFGDFPIQVLTTKIGGRLPLGVGAAGLALLAWEPQGEIERIIDRLEYRLKEHGGMSVRALHQLVASAQARGYSVVGNYAVRGVLGVGVPIRDKVGRTVAAISVSSVAERMHSRQQIAIAEVIQREIQASEMVI